MSVSTATAPLPLPLPVARHGGGEDEDAEDPKEKQCKDTTSPAAPPNTGLFFYENGGRRLSPVSPSVQQQGVAKDRLAEQTSTQGNEDDVLVDLQRVNCSGVLPDSAEKLLC